MIYAMFVLALAIPAEPQSAGFRVEMDANPAAIYVIRFGDTIIEPGKTYVFEGEVPQSVKLTITYLDGHQEVSASIVIRLVLDHVVTRKLRLENAYPALVKL